MEITTDDIMEVLAQEISMKIVDRSPGGIYRLKHKRSATIVTMHFDEKTGILTSSLLQDVMSEKFKRIANDLWKEYMGEPVSWPYASDVIATIP